MYSITGSVPIGLRDSPVGPLADKFIRPARFIREIAAA